MGRTHEQVSWLKSWHDHGFSTRLLVKENLSIFSRTHEQIKLVKEKLLVCTGLNLSNSMVIGITMRITIMVVIVMMTMVMIVIVMTV